MAQVNMNFSSNSDKSRELSNRPPVEPIVSASNVTSAPNKKQKLIRAFISPDVNDIGEYLVYDVAIPAIKNTLVDIVNIIFNGGLSSRRGVNNYPNWYNRTYYSNTNYRGISTGNAYNTYQNNQMPEPSPSTSDTIDYRNIVITYGIDAAGNKVDAERESGRIIADLQNEILEYGRVSVAHLYRLCGVTPDWTYERIGWVGDPGQIGRRAVPGGYQIIVPNAVPIEV